jgi:hypothetical protein
MAKLLTPKKLDKKKDITTKVEEYGWNKVSTWTKQNLTELQQSSKLPIITELTNGNYTVATYKVEKISAVCWRAAEFDFMDKRSAIFYCALVYIGKLKDAVQLKEADGIVGKLDMDKAMFRVKLDNAHTVGDQFKIDLYSSRFDESKRHLSGAKQELEKIIQLAKYHMNLGI